MLKIIVLTSEALVAFKFIRLATACMIKAHEVLVSDLVIKHYNLWSFLNGI